MTLFNIFQHADLDGSSFVWKGSSTGILLLHGFTATTVEVRPMARFLHDFGFTVSGPLLPGHGKTPEDMNRVSWKDWFNCAESAYLNLQKECDRVFVLGESMGALISMLLTVAHPEIAGAMLFAPALKVPGLGASEFVWPFKPYIVKKHIDETMEWQGFNVVPLHAASQLLKLQRRVKHSMHKINVPTLIFQGKLDRSIDQISSVLVLEGINSTDKELVFMEESTHCVLIDRQLPDAEEACLEFIRKHL
ncbi:MAG TPA: alpha/beta fold hydrolase [Leptolinea sp.]